MSYIYGLIDPITNQLRYVGYTTKEIADRAGQHWRGRKRGQSHKNHWITSLWDRHQVKPEVVLIEEIDSSDWCEAECFWIEYYRAIGCNLTNNSLGGLGRIAGTKLSSEHRANISAGLNKASSEGRLSVAKPSLRGRPAWNRGLKVKQKPKTGMNAKGVPRPWYDGEKHSAHRRKQATLISPTGEVHHVVGVGKFCRERGLKSRGIHALVQGVLHTSQGWRCERPIDIQ